MQPRTVALAVPRGRLTGRLRAVARLLPALLPMLIFIPFVLAPPLNHDVAAVLAFSERWLGGERLYVDLIDVNPPLIFVLNLIPAFIAAHTGLDAVLTLQLCLLALGAVVWTLCFRVRDRACEGPGERALLDVLPGLFIFGAGYDFGQRETLMAACALPYVLAAARRAQGGRPPGRIATAILAAVGFALKPYFLAIPALVELGVAVSRPWRATLRDPVPWILAAVWLAYVATLPLLFPDYLRTVVPLVWAFYLDLGETTPLTVLLKPRMTTALVLFLPLFVLAARRGAHALPRLLALAGLGALVSAMAQHKGWSYHIAPIEMFATALGTVLAARWFDRIGVVRPAIPAVLIALAFLYILANGELPAKEIAYSRSETAELVRQLRPQGEGGRVLVMSPNIAPIFPALNYLHAKLTLPEMNMWLLEGAYRTCLPNGRRYREVVEMGPTELSVYRGIAEDLARAPPAAIVIDRASGIPWCDEGFDFIAYFTRNPLFAEAFSHYEQTGQAGNYRVYKRKD
jgi:hypothetical protein